MGKRGPRPTPTEILKLRGSTLVTPEREAGEVHGPMGTPDRPDWLDDQAKAAWDEIAPLLQDMGILTRIDGNALMRRHDNHAASGEVLFHQFHRQRPTLVIEIRHRLVHHP